MNLIEITSLNDPGVDLFASLTESQLRNRLDPEKGIFIAESPKVIAIALDRGYTPLAMLAEHKHITGDAAPLIARCGNIPIYTGPNGLLAQLTGYDLTRGVLCAMRRPQPLTVDDVCRDARRIAVVDSVVNATNTGAIFRAAASLGMDGVILTNTASDPLNRRSVRVSMGTVFMLPWCCVPGGPLLIRRLKALGFATAALALSEDSITIDNPLLKQADRLALVLGNEGDGLPPALLKECDYVAKIPMQRGVDSLNVAAAAAVAFWEVRTQE
ncbi:MAG: RNA methyltransferase [Bacteroidales bacterium]|nr:RNA methyltransferase [Bacteroidales bacterium]